VLVAGIDEVGNHSAFAAPAAAAAAAAAAAFLLLLVLVLPPVFLLVAARLRHGCCVLRCVGLLLKIEHEWLLAPFAAAPQVGQPLKLRFARFHFPHLSQNTSHRHTAASKTMAARPPELSMDAKWEASIDLTLRRLVYGSIAGGAAGLLLFRACPNKQIFPPEKIHIVGGHPTSHALVVGVVIVRGRGACGVRWHLSQGCTPCHPGLASVAASGPPILLCFC
jgi:hypothetical protein